MPNPRAMIHCLLQMQVKMGLGRCRAWMTPLLLLVHWTAASHSLQHPLQHSQGNSYKYHENKTDGLTKAVTKSPFDQYYFRYSASEVDNTFDEDRGNEKMFQGASEKYRRHNKQESLEKRSFKHARMFEGDSDYNADHRSKHRASERHHTEGVYQATRKDLLVTNTLDLLNDDPQDRLQGNPQNLPRKRSQFGPKGKSLNQLEEKSRDILLDDDPSLQNPLDLLEHAEKKYEEGE